MPRKCTAIIVGGGIGGLTAAIALRRIGLDVTVCERAPELKELGAGIALAPNAMKALALLGLGERVAAAGETVASGTIKTWKGAVLAQAGAEAQALISVCVHRAELQRVLVAHLHGARLRLEHTFVGLEHSGNGVRARFANGEVLTADLLVGADGLHSAVRATVHGAARPRYAGYTAWRAVTPFDTDLSSSESWGHGKRFGIVPIGGGRLYWFATRNAPEGEPVPPEGHKQRLVKLFEAWHPPIPAIIDATEPSAILRHDLYDRDPLEPPWGVGRVTLLGDAAHPSTPNLGQGACQAIEDAVVLTRQLQDAADIEAALRRYETLRAPRTAYITTLSRHLGRIAQLQNPVACTMRNAFLKAFPSYLRERQLKGIIRFDERGNL